MNHLVALLRSVIHRVWRRSIRHTLDHTETRAVMGLNLEIAAGVLHPAHFASSRVLGEAVMRLDLAGRSVADIGTGSGFLALLAARKGARVLAIDLNPLAVRCAEGNAARNGLSDRITAIRSDVFDSVPPEARFDWVITNPPFYPRAATDDQDLAFAAGEKNEFFVKLAAQVRTRLRDDGQVVLVHSSDVDFAPIRRLFELGGMTETSARAERSLFEDLTVRIFSPSSFGPTSRRSDPQRT